LFYLQKNRDFSQIFLNINNNQHTNQPNSSFLDSSYTTPTTSDLHYVKVIYLNQTSQQKNSNDVQQTDTAAKAQFHQNTHQCLIHQSSLSRQKRTFPIPGRQHRHRTQSPRRNLRRNRRQTRQQAHYQQSQGDFY